MNPLQWNDWGYTFGGPFYIPGHYNTDKSKTFFFWSEDWRRYRQGNPLGGGVPSLLERTGDFSQCDPNAAGGPGKASINGGKPATDNDAAYAGPVASGCNLIHDPSMPAGMYFDTVQGAANYLTTHGIDTAANLAQDMANTKDLLNAMVPLPNSGIDGWSYAAKAPTNWRQEQIRVDQNIGEKTRVFYRLTKDAWNQQVVPALWQWASYDTIQTKFDGPGVSQVLNITHVFKPTLTNEFVAAYTTDHILLYPTAGTSPTTVTKSLARPSDFVMKNMYTANAASSAALLPSFEACGGDSFCFAEYAGNVPWFNSNPIITWKDNVAWVHGGHTTKFGFYLENYRKNEQFGTPTQGALNNGAYGAETTGNGLADYFLGRIDSYQEGT